MPPHPPPNEVVTDTEDEDEANEDAEAIDEADDEEEEEAAPAPDGKLDHWNAGDQEPARVLLTPTIAELVENTWAALADDAIASRPTALNTAMLVFIALPLSPARRPMRAASKFDSSLPQALPRCSRRLPRRARPYTHKASKEEVEFR